MPSVPKIQKPSWASKKRTGFQESGRQTDTRYHTILWRKTRKLVFARDPLCVMCTKENIVSASTQCDHIIPIRPNDPDEKFYDINGLQGLCEHHHKSKSAKERGDRL